LKFIVPAHNHDETICIKDRVYINLNKYKENHNDISQDKKQLKLNFLKTNPNLQSKTQNMLDPSITIHKNLLVSKKSPQ
jgi:hypothetical protein